MTGYLFIPITLKKILLLKNYLFYEKKYEDLCRLNSEEKIIFQAAKLISEEIKLLKDTMPLPPRPFNLEVGQFLLSPYLKQLLNTILSGKRECTRLKQSFG